MKKNLLCRCIVMWCEWATCPATHVSNEYTIFRQIATIFSVWFDCATPPHAHFMETSSHNQRRGAHIASTVDRKNVASNGDRQKPQRLPAPVAAQKIFQFPIFIIPSSRVHKFDGATRQVCFAAKLVSNDACNLLTLLLPIEKWSRDSVQRSTLMHAWDSIKCESFAKRK